MKIKIWIRQIIQLKLEDVRAVLAEKSRAGHTAAIRTLLQKYSASKLSAVDPYEKKLLGITAMQKRLGKSRFDGLLTAYIEKPQGKPTLVPEINKRPAMNNAKTDFMEEN